MVIKNITFLIQYAKTKLKCCKTKILLKPFIGYLQNAPLKPYIILLLGEQIILTPALENLFIYNNIGLVWVNINGLILD